MAEPLSSHEHGNCQVCDQLQAADEACAIAAEDRITALQAERDAAQAERDDLKARNDRLALTLAFHADAQNVTLTPEYADELERAAAERDAARAEVARLKVELEAARFASAGKGRKVYDRLSARISDTESQNEELRASCSGLAVRCDKAQAERDQWRTSSQHHLAEATRLCDERDALSEQLQQTQANYGTLEAERDRLRAALLHAHAITCATIHVDDRGVDVCGGCFVSAALDGGAGTHNSTTEERTS